MPVLLHSIDLLSRANELSPAKRLYERVLIVDRSNVARELLACSLHTYCAETTALATVAEARELDDGKISLVVLDATVEGALAWFEERCARPAHPAFVVVTSRPSQAEETRVSMSGAIGYLPKPLAFRQLSHALVSATEPFAPAPPRAQAFPLAEASIADPTTGEPQLSCQIVNLSVDGALLATAAPIPIGAPLLLRLVLDGHSVLTRARVARVQEPGWGGLAGCGVVFEYDSDESRRFVERFVDARRGQRKHSRVSFC
jgi:CheY-like chemotaxis protein